MSPPGRALCVKAASMCPEHACAGGEGSGVFLPIPRKLPVPNDTGHSQHPAERGPQCSPPDSRARMLLPFPHLSQGPGVKDFTKSWGSGHQDQERNDTVDSCSCRSSDSSLCTKHANYVV